MKLPQTIDKRALAALAPQDTHAVRVIVRRVANQTPYRVRGKMHHYLVEWDFVLQAHILDIPESVWMHDFPPGPYRDNASISHDIQGCRSVQSAPLVFLLVPYAQEQAQPAVMGAAATPSGIADFIAPLKDLLNKLKAPAIMHEAVEVMAEDSVEVFGDFVDSLTVDEDEAPASDPGQTAATDLVPVAATATQINPKTGKPYTKEALRMRAMRERKKEATA
jgi:hypothetical protein